MKNRYRVEVSFFTRSYDGDDWITGEHSFSYDKLVFAIEKALNPFDDTKGLIDSKVLDMQDSKYGEVIWKKDWFENTVTDYTTIPDFDYHYREYD